MRGHDPVEPADDAEALRRGGPHLVHHLVRTEDHERRGGRRHVGMRRVGRVRVVHPQVAGVGLAPLLVEVEHERAAPLDHLPPAQRRVRHAARAAVNVPVVPAAVWVVAVLELGPVAVEGRAHAPLE
eukprot:scaffold6563_cov70-Phaeocystis_antarctica.AAC.3